MKLPTTTQCSREVSPRRPPACENAQHTSRTAEQEGRHRPKPIAEFPAYVAAEIDADKDEEFHGHDPVSTARAAGEARPKRGALFQVRDAIGQAARSSRRNSSGLPIANVNSPTNGANPAS